MSDWKKYGNRYWCVETGSLIKRRNYFFAEDGLIESGDLIFVDKKGDVLICFTRGSWSRFFIASREDGKPISTGSWKNLVCEKREKAAFKGKDQDILAGESRKFEDVDEVVVLVGGKPVSVDIDGGGDISGAILYFEALLRKLKDLNVQKKMDGKKTTNKGVLKNG